MTMQTPPTVKDMEFKVPKNFDLKRGEAFTRKLIERNKEWVKEMAKK